MGDPINGLAVELPTRSPRTVLAALNSVGVLSL
jgi:hypothetical protein